MPISPSHPLATLAKLDSIPLLRYIHVLRNVIFVLFLWNSLKKSIFLLRFRGLQGCIQDLGKYLKRTFWLFLRSSSSTVQNEIDQQVGKTLASIAKDMQLDPLVKTYASLPKNPLSVENVEKELRNRIGKISDRWSGSVYHQEASLLHLQTLAFSLFLVTNPLHPEMFRGLRQMEAEILHMLLHLFHHPKGCGNLTSGGTESILMACKAYRDRANKIRPQMVIPITAHAAFDKAGQYLNIDVLKIPIQANGQVDIKCMRRAITSNTIMIVGSAPNFPHGIIDDLESLSELALKAKVPLHVDACLGSFLLPFLGEVYPNPPLFDFRLKGVTSISLDPHKYGLGPKGTSAILYRSSDYRKYQYFVAPDWTGGIYGSPTMAGSRSGALIAGCWATMLSLGVEGYRQHAKKVLTTTQVIVDGLKKFPQLHVVGSPMVSVVAFTSTPASLVYHLNDFLLAKGWHLNLLQHPHALHLACTLLTQASHFLTDLQASLEAILDLPERTSTSQAIYGTAAQVDTSIVHDVVSGFLDLLTTDLTPPKIST